MDKIAAVRPQARRAVLEKTALDNVGSEIAGHILNPVSSAAGGAALGTLIGGLVAGIRRKSLRAGVYGATRGAGAGALIGAAASPLITTGGVLAGILRKRRTRKEQQEHDSKSHYENFIPGVAAYNATKRTGRVLAGVGEPDGEKKAAEAYAAGFCKAAEAMGVDPDALYKYAFNGVQATAATAVKRAGVVDMLGRGWGRYVELLKGTGPRLAGYRGRNMMGDIGGFIRQLDGKGDTAAGYKLKNFLNTLAASGSEGSELRKVVGTRVGTGAAGLLGLKALFGGSSSGKTADNMTDPKWQSATSAGTQKAVEYLRQWQSAARTGTQKSVEYLRQLMDGIRSRMS